jgi:hypothetical protein
MGVTPSITHTPLATRVDQKLSDAFKDFLSKYASILFC